MKTKLITMLMMGLLMSNTYAIERKDCRLHVVASQKNAAGTKLEYVEVEDKHVKGDTTKGQCLDNDKIKKAACDGLMDQCKPVTVTAGGPAGLVGGWVQWGTSREDCPKLCDGFVRTVGAQDVLGEVRNFDKYSPSKQPK